MPLSRGTFIVIPLFLTGCLSKDDKIVDLAGAVFLIFLVLIGIKYATKQFAESRVFVYLSAFMRKYIKYSVYPIYCIALGFILTGILYSGIHRVQILSGLVTGIIGFNVSRLSLAEDDESKKFHLEVISLGVGILIVLSILWVFGAGLFSEFSLLI